MGFFSPTNWLRSILGDGQVFYTLVGGSTTWAKASTDEKKIKTILENPAALYIFLLVCELYSMGKYKLYKGDKEIETDPILDLLKKPNPLQTANQFKWDYMFHRKLGNANLYIDSDIVSPNNKLYFLHNDCIEWPKEITDHSMSLVLSKAREKEINDQILQYKTNKQTLKFKYYKLQQFFDISNGLGNFYESPSRIDALFKIVSNSDNALKSKNINTDFSSKFLVSGTVGVEQTSKMPMGDADKQSVESAMRSKKRSIFATKTQTAINRFIENGSIIEQLDKAWMNDAFIIGKMLNIPKDVIEMLGDGATYENQEKARAMVISYCIQPDADDFTEGIMKYFDYPPDYKLTMDYSHLPFVQTLEKDRSETMDKKAFAFLRLVNAGADQAEAASILGLDLTKFTEPRNTKTPRE